MVQHVETQVRVGRIHLQIGGCRLDALLLVSGELGQAVGEGVGDAEIHRHIYFTGQSLRPLITGKLPCG